MFSIIFCIQCRWTNSNQFGWKYGIANMHQQCRRENVHRATYFQCTPQTYLNVIPSATISTTNVTNMTMATTNMCATTHNQIICLMHVNTAFDNIYFFIELCIQPITWKHKKPHITTAHVHAMVYIIKNHHIYIIYYMLFAVIWLGPTSCSNTKEGTCFNKTSSTCAVVNCFTCATTWCDDRNTVLNYMLHKQYAVRLYAAQMKSKHCWNALWFQHSFCKLHNMKRLLTQKWVSW